LQGWGWTVNIHPDDLEGMVARWRACLASGEVFQYESRIRRADGQYLWFLHRMVPERDAQGKILIWYGSSIDIDDRMRAEQELKRAFAEIKVLKDQLQRENLALKEEIDQASMFEEIVGASVAIKRVLVLLNKVAPTDSTVLITGETGTGKELAARAIHNRSGRSRNAFVAVNCAAIPASLIASELFGHEKGAFTGATQRRLGRFELADGGTIFLDEVGDLPAETQIALLRVLQERELERVGGSQSVAVDVRVIAATNRNLQEAVQAGSFRSDLFYRLNVFPLRMPPLRERVEDIPLLVAYLVQRYAAKMGKRIDAIDRRSLELLQSYHWPGNIRELQNVVERAVVLSEGAGFAVDENWLLSASPAPAAGGTVFASLAEQERGMIENALQQSRGRVAGPQGAAVRLGIPRSTLESRIKSLNISKHRFRSA
jgi:formate hydrogenlyase transcriptional activator